MKALAIAAVSGLFLGTTAGAFATPPKLRQEPSPYEAAHYALTEDPGLALYNATMGAEPRTAPQPYMRVAYSEPDLGFNAEMEAQLVAVEGEVQAQIEAAKADYARLFATPYDVAQADPVPASDPPTSEPLPSSEQPLPLATLAALQ